MPCNNLLLDEGETTHKALICFCGMVHAHARTVPRRTQGREFSLPFTITTSCFAGGRGMSMVG